jgi:DNA-binding NarL/FixJ family response regulator
MTSTKAFATILIVDDHPMMRDGLTALISNRPDLSVCGEADDVTEALRLVDELKPDLVLIDISLKTGHGIDLISKIRERHPAMNMLVISMYDELIYAERALEAGASGYLCKQSARNSLLDAIHQVLAGKIYLSPEMTDRILSSRVGGMIKPGETPIKSLSNRELEVLTLIGQGLTTRGVASQLHLSVHTIDTYREKLKTKLNLANGTALNRYAVQWVLENG